METFPKSLDSQINVSGEFPDQLIRRLMPNFPQISDRFYSIHRVIYPLYNLSFEKEAIVYV